MEALEPRLLLSADIDYHPIPNPLASTEFTLSIVNSGGLKVRLVDGDGGVTESAITAGDDGVINISSDTYGAGFGDTITIDLDTLNLLNAFGDDITINFKGGLQDVVQDHLILDGDAVLTVGLTINSGAHVSLIAGSSIAADDVALNVAVTDTGLPGVGTDNDFAADSAATLDVNGAIIANNVTLTATSTLTLDNASLAISTVQFAFILGHSEAAVNIGSGADITIAAH
ncbi:LEPR-XLL domain-containing protein [Massilia sp. H-1]|nr:LEPR-XLL domain-containing protein [Massilia sp. H-1]